MFLLNDKDIEAIRSGSWEIPCLSMELVKSDGQVTFSGIGFIRQDEHRLLKFTLIDKEHEGILSVFQDSDEQEVKAGQIVPPEHFYKLTATDTSERCWVAKHLSGFDTTGGSHKGVVVEGIVHEIRCRRDMAITMPALAKINSPLYVSYRMFRQFKEFPCNTDIQTKVIVDGKPSRSSRSFSVAKAESDLFAFELIRDGNDVKFTAEEKQAGGVYPCHPELRFEEALQFVMGQPLNWEILTIAVGKQETICVRPLTNGFPVPHTAPPISHTRHEYFSEFWTLFKKYLDHIWSYSEEGWHPISRRVLSLQHGMSSLWTIRMLTAGVEVEGMLNDQYAPKMPPPETMVKVVDEIMEFTDKLVAFEKAKAGVNQRTVEEISLERVKSSLGHLKSSSSARNKLLSLSTYAIVRSEDVAAWELVRNNSAHAVASETQISQENLLRLNKVLVLFYHLVFNLIGYHGAYTDYGELGHPVKSYPIKSAANQ